jgi:uncharacterized protein YkwD
MVAHGRIVSWVWILFCIVVGVCMNKGEGTAASFDGEIAHGATFRQAQDSPLGQRSTYFPLIATAREGLYVHPQNRRWSIAFFHAHYTIPATIPMEWTGNHNQCNAGSVSPAFQAAIARRINYFRAMAGVPAVKLDSDYSAKAQQAALMMSVNRRLSHGPTPDWTCYTESGNEGANSSNLFLDLHGVDAITGYMASGGGDSFPVGHRRWMLYPPTRLMGVGDIPPQNGYPAANALWVFDDTPDEPHPKTREPFVAWPPPGYVPYQVVFPRWSFSYPAADFSVATVSMSINGQPLSLSVQPVINGFGVNTITWEPMLPGSTPPHDDMPAVITIHNVGIEGVYQNFTYEVIVINPDVPEKEETGVLTVEPRLLSYSYWREILSDLWR